MTRTWATCGQTPILRSKVRWSKLSTIGAITTTGKFSQQTHQGSIKGPQVLGFINHLLVHTGGKLTVIFDNARIHHTKARRALVEQEPRLEVEYIPAYAPELNPIELVWAYVKRHLLANFCPPDLTTLKARLVQCWQRVRYINLPNRLLSGPPGVANLGRCQ
jgi:putative transposase